MANVLSAYALLELDEAKSAINAGTNFTQDEELTMYINGVTDFIENYCNRKIVVRAYVEVFDGDGTNRYFTRNIPILTGGSYTISVVYNEDSDVVPAASVLKNTETGEVYLDDSYAFETGFQNCSVTYSAGFATIPGSIKTAASIIISHLWRVRDKQAENMATISIEGQAITLKPEAIPGEALAMLQRYRRASYA